MNSDDVRPHQCWALAEVERLDPKFIIPATAGHRRRQTGDRFTRD